MTNRFMTRTTLTEEERRTIQEAEKILREATRAMENRLLAKGYENVDCAVHFGWLGYETCVRATSDWLKPREERRFSFDRSDRPVCVSMEEALEEIARAPVCVKWTSDLVAKTLGIEPETEKFEQKEVA
jgi:DNA-directed RNA polymerase subunit F